MKAANPSTGGDGDSVVCRKQSRGLLGSFGQTSLPLSVIDRGQ